MKILVTRPIEEAKEFKELLEKEGFAVELFPLIDIERSVLTDEEVILFKQANPKAIITTSANSIKYIAEYIEDKSLLLYVVGNTSFNLAKSMGFANVITPNIPKAANLVDKIIVGKEISKEDMIIYAKGEITSYDIYTKLKSEGFNISQVITYKAKEVEKFDNVIKSQLLNKEIDIITFFSKRTAEIFVKLCKENDITNLANIDVFVISDAIKDKIMDIKFKKIYVNNEPYKEAMINFIKHSYKELN